MNRDRKYISLEFRPVFSGAKSTKEAMLDGN
jgi:hypothetical protein